MTESLYTCRHGDSLKPCPECNPEPAQLDRIETLLGHIRELLTWQPGVPQHLWTADRAKKEAEAQAFRMEVARSYAESHGGIVFVNTPITEQKV